MSTLKPVHWLFLTMLLGGPVTAENGQTNETFSLPDAVVLFGAYNELRVTAPGGTLSITPPMDASGKEHPFSFPSISPDGALVAASFAVTFDESQPRYAFRNALGIYSLRLRTWNTFGQFDAVGRPAFNLDSSKVAVVVHRSLVSALFLVNLKTYESTFVPNTDKLDIGSPLSWSPDGQRLVAVSAHDDGRSFVVIFTLATSRARELTEGRSPTWSPVGDWIAYNDLRHLKCQLIHPDGTGARVVRDLGGGFWHTLFFGYREFVWGLVWSPDGTQLLLNEMKGDGPNNDVVRFGVASGRSQLLWKNAWPVFGWVGTQ